MNNKELQEAILYQDSSFLIANKLPGISAQSDLTKDISFHEMLEKFGSKKLFLIHRLDRPTSGVMIFAKRKKAAAYFSDLDGERIEKIYYAAVKNPPKNDEDQLIHFLEHDSKQRKSIISTKENKYAKKATLRYQVIDKIDNYSLLKIKLTSGRFHQIRAQLSAIGSPIKGDVKYGARRANKDRSINLHAISVSFPLLYEEEGIKVTASVPNDPVWNAFANKNPEIKQNRFEKWKVKK